MRFALAGNPNSGKTTLFNALTGSSAHVGNWPGVTVEKREGSYRGLPERVQIVDLPGIYSLSPYTPEEVVTRNFLLQERPDCIVNIVDATNLERNLYLTTQLMEVDCPVVVALNMMDVVEKQGGTISADALRGELNVPVVPISALRGQGIEELMQQVYSAAGAGRQASTVLAGTNLEKAVSAAERLLEGEGGGENRLFHAVKLVEGDELECGKHPALAQQVSEFLKRVELPEEFAGDFEGAVADARYRYIGRQFAHVYTRGKSRASVSDRADRLLTHRWAGIPIFLIIMFAVFHLTFSGNFLGLGFAKIEIESPNAFTENALGLEEDEDGKVYLSVPSPGVFLQNLLGWGMGAVIGSGSYTEGGEAIPGTGIAGALERADAPDWVSGVLCDGLLAGLDAVLSFLPQILLLFLFLAILENSGYMARVAFLVDRAFRRFGLSGKAFMPLLMCFGCAVPGIMATRTLENEKERHMAVALSPFFSCGAKLPIWATFAAILGSMTGDLIVFAMYLIGIVVAVLAAILLRRTTLRGETPPFIMELPAYHFPQFKATMLFLWEKLKHYLFRAATIIAGASIVIWFLSSFTWNWQYIGNNPDPAVIQSSMLAGIGNLLRPLFVPLGFASGTNGWMFVDAALTGLIAKEMVVATMGILGGDPAGAVAGGNLIVGMTLPAAFSFMAFNLLSVPCMAAVAAAHAEMKDRKKTFRLIVFWLLTAYSVSLVIFGLGNLFRLIGGATLGALEITVMVLAVAIVAFTVVFNVVRHFVRKKKGITGCGGCSGCASCTGCAAADPKPEQEKR